MTYEEIKKKLTTCEKKLKEIQASNSKPKNYEQAVSKLTILKESLEKQLKEAEKGIVYTDDENTAKDLADDGTNVKLTKEVEGVKFSIEETKSIAKIVGKALGKSLHQLGEEMESMKIKDIDENSFEIYVVYKNDSDDQFSFYISEDRLHLVDFSFDKELVDVGVKPSGEAIVNVDVLANEFVKHFKSLSEGMSDQEFADAKEKERLEKHPERDMIKKIQALIQNANKIKEGEYAADKNNVNVFGYQTQHFDICPGAKSLFEKILKDGKIKDEQALKNLAQLHDILFTIEKIALKDSDKAKKYLDKAIKVASEIYVIGNRIGLDQNTNLSYIQSHIEKINDAAREEEVNEAPDSMYYFKVKKTDKASLNGLQDVIETFYHPVRFANIVDDDGAGNVIFYIKKEDYDEGMIDDIEGNGVALVDTNIPNIGDSGEEADTDYMKRRKAEKDYQQEIADRDYDADQAQKDDEEEYERGYDDDGLPLGEDALGFSDIEKFGSKAASDIDISVRRDPNYTFGKRPYEDDKLRYKYAKQLGYLSEEDDLVGGDSFEKKQALMKKLAAKYGTNDPVKLQMLIDKFGLSENEAEDQGGDLDIGHQDDEPSMLKSTAYESATYAAKLYKKLAKYDQFDGEVDFPNWWQSKLILAKDYLSKAFHYLDSEEKQPMIDKLALEGKYKSDAQRKAIHAKKAEMNEASYDDAISELRDIVDRAEDLGQEAREIVRQYFPSELSRLDGYGAFNFVYSNNRYDTTLGKFVDRLEEEGYDDEFDESIDELFGSKVNYDDIIGPIVKRLQDLKKYVSKKEPDAMDDLQKVIRAFEIFDEKMAYGTHMELEEGQAAIKKQLDKIDQALKQHKDKTIAIVRKDANQRTEDEKAHLAKMADLTKKKKDLLDKYGDAVAGINRNQELDEIEAKPIPDTILRGYNMNVKNAQTMAQALISLFNQINDKETMDFTKHSGMKRVLAMLDTIARTKDTETPDSAEKQDVPNA